MLYSATQHRAIDGANISIRNGGIYRIGGYAGTGKTTIAKEIVKTTNKVPIICTFTGKASSVLRKKGLDHATTIHQSIYRYDEDRRRFFKRKEVEGDYFLLDEGSMVPTKLWQDIRSFRLPVVVLGDPGQLEPIGDDAKLMQNCDIVLDEIFRYGESIEQFAEIVRKEGEYPLGNSNVKVLKKTDTVAFKEPADVWLCGFNRTRVTMNKLLRGDKEENKIVEGDKLVGLMNNWDIGITNGMLMTVLKVIDRHGPLLAAECLLDNGKTKEALLWEGNLNKDKTIDFRKFREYGLPESTIVVDYGYCLTVHKFQGSQDKIVSIIDEQCDLWSPARWRYTAVTRAEEHVRIFV